jgi:hypothetical protein
MQLAARQALHRSAAVDGTLLLCMQPALQIPPPLLVSPQGLMVLLQTPPLSRCAPSRCAHLHSQTYTQRQLHCETFVFQYNC